LPFSLTKTYIARQASSPVRNKAISMRSIHHYNMQAHQVRLTWCLFQTP